MAQQERYNETHPPRGSFGPERRENERSENEQSAGPKRGATPDPEVLATPRRRVFTFEQKQRIVWEADAARTPGEVGALLRREGIYSSHLAAWRKALKAGPQKRGPKPMSAEELAQREENRKLQAKVASLERQLAQAHTIIEVQKKLSQILGIPLDTQSDNESD